MCVNPNDPVFYVYVYLDPRKPGKYVYGEYMFDYEPFYVGKGSGKRAYVHLHNKNNKDLFERIQSIKTPFIMFYKKRLVEYSAFKLETDIIKAVGKKITNTGLPHFIILGMNKDKEQDMNIQMKQRKK